jgi:hypothetical protein
MANVTFPAYSRVYAPRAGWFGGQLVNTHVSTIGKTIGDSNTVSLLLPVPGFITSYNKGEAVLVALNLNADVAAVSAGQTVTVQAFKRANTGTPADKTLTATLSVMADIITTTRWTYAFPITATGIDTLFQTTDACRLDFVSSGSVTTQPQVTISATWAIRRVG